LAPERPSAAHDRRPGASPAPQKARSIALAALLRVEEGAYANVVLPALLEESGLPTRDRAFVTELVYGTTRMRRALDHALQPFLRGPLDPDVRAALRLGAYQLLFLETPAHAAVGETVEAAPVRARGLVNAVLRRVAEAGPPRWPDPPTRLSYPDWIVRRLAADLGPAAAEAALERMNQAPAVTEREDGYVQDLASQWVAEAVGAQPGEVIADLCAAPGGKATLMAEAGAKLVVAGDLQPHRVGLVRQNLRRLALQNVAPMTADARRPPLRPVDRVLVDAPCSGLGVLRRRPDARWRIEEGAVGRLAALQRQLLVAAAGIVRPGGALVYSVCTLTRTETEDVDRWLAESCLLFVAVPPPGEPWAPVGRGARLLPQAADTDGMYLLRLQKAGG
jgi:16S rRNA (cytosine967-C5)-methyltransferase